MKLINLFFKRNEERRKVAIERILYLFGFLGHINFLQYIFMVFSSRHKNFYLTCFKKAFHKKREHNEMLCSPSHKAVLRSCSFFFQIINFMRNLKIKNQQLFLVQLVLQPFFLVLFCPEQLFSGYFSVVV